MSKRPLNTALDLPTELPGMGTDGDDLLAGGGGIRQLFGFGGNDTLISGQDGAGPLYADQVSLWIAHQSDVVEFGDDVLIGGPGNTTMFGDSVDVAIVPSDAESVSVTTGDDVFYTCVGNDGSGNDAYGDARELSIGVGTVGGSVDFVAGDDVFFNSNDTRAYGDADRVRVIQTGEAGSVHVTLGNDTIFGGSDIFGDCNFLEVYGAHAEKITVAAGNDFLNATGYDHAYMYGDFRTVKMQGGDGGTGLVVCGDDTLVGGASDDRMTGDLPAGNYPDYEDNWNIISGADRFVFESLFGNDIIYDFNVGLDSLHFLGFDGFGIDDIAMSYDAPNDELRLDLTAIGGGTVTLLGIEEIAEGDIVFA